MGWVEEKTEGAETNSEDKWRNWPQMNTDFSVGCFLNILKGYDNHLEEAEINDEEETVPLGAK